MAAAAARANEPGQGGGLGDVEQAPGQEVGGQHGEQVEAVVDIAVIVRLDQHRSDSQPAVLCEGRRPGLLTRPLNWGAARRGGDGQELRDRGGYPAKPLAAALVEPPGDQADRPGRR